MTAVPGLGGIGVLVTRPEQQAQALCAAIEQAGGRVVRLPLLEIARPARVEVAREALREARDDDWWLFTSPNAVRWAARLSPPDEHAWPARLAAAGRGTAAALVSMGRPDAACPATDGAAGLLALPELSAVGAGTRITVVCGEHSPAWLSAGLRARGVAPRLASVYRRVRVSHDAATVTACVMSVAAAIVTSGEALEHLCALVPAPSRAALLVLQLALPSARVVEMARRFGFRDAPLVPGRVSDEGFVRALVEWRQNKARTTKGHAP